jgi:hypothetical protein
MAKALNFWTQDADGERWLINGPELLIAANRPKRKEKRKMYANKPRHGTKAWMAYIRKFRKNPGGRKRKHHAKRSRNMYSAGAIANRPKTRTITRYVKATRRRSNPGGGGGRGLLGLAGFPGIEPITGAFAGLAVPPVLNYLVSGYIPAAITGNTFGRYAVRAAEVVLPAWLVRRYVNRNVGNIMMFVGIGKLLFDAVREFAPGIPGLSGGIGYQPMLGVYPQQRRGLPPARMVPMMQTSMQSGVPTRLDSGSRF